MSDISVKVNHYRFISGDFFFANELFVLESNNSFILDGYSKIKFDSELVLPQKRSVLKNRIDMDYLKNRDNNF